MELRHYVQIILKRWWLIVPLTLISLTTALVLSYSRPNTYQSVATYVTKFDENLNTIGDTIYALDTLASRQRLFVTYCQVLTSQTVREQAYRIGGIDPALINSLDYEINCNVLPEANVLMVLVRGPSPALVMRLNEAVGRAGIARADTLYRYFGLEALDPPRLEDVSSNRLQQGLIGGFLGLAVGISIAFIFEYLRSPAERMEMLAIRHPKLGIYNERYFQQRLVEEINRSRSRHRPLSVGLLRLVPTEDFVLLPEDAQDMLLRAAALRMSDGMRSGDIIAYLGRYTFAILLPETPGHEAQSVIERLHTDVRTHTFHADAYLTNFSANTGLVESSGGILDLKQMLSKASAALQVAEQKGENAIHLERTSAPAFALNAGVEAEEELNLRFDESIPFTGSELEQMLMRTPANTDTRGNGAARGVPAVSDETSEDDEKMR